MVTVRARGRSIPCTERNVSRSGLLSIGRYEDYVATRQHTWLGTVLPSMTDKSAKRPKKIQKAENFGSIYTLRSLPDQGGDMCKVCFRFVLKCEFV
jgi:hypothetical protein